MTTEQTPLEISVAEVHGLQLASSDFLLLDCREPAEHQIVAIAGSQLIPMRAIPDRVAELEPFRHRKIVVHCHHGGRSLQVAQWLRRQGFAHAQSMAGGVDAWAVEIDPQLPRY